MASGSIQYKTEEEIDLIRASALVLARAHGEVAGLVKEGVTTRQLDKRAEEFIRDHGGVPSFKGYNKFPYSLCLSPNSVVVHGFATDEPLKSGDILSVDCGVFLNGFHSDSAYTYSIGEVAPEVLALLRETKASLYNRHIFPVLLYQHHQLLVIRYRSLVFQFPFGAKPHH